MTACHDLQGKVEVTGTFRLTLEDKRAFPVKKKLRKLKGNSPDKEYRQDGFETLPSYSTRRSYAAGPLKSPLMQLNEMGKEVDYNVVSQTGPPHCPTFVVEVIVDGRAYRGKGKSKKHARQNAAERALRQLRRYLPRPRERNQISDSEEEDDHDDAPRMTSLRADKLVLAVKVESFVIFNDSSFSRDHCKEREVMCRGTYWGCIGFLLNFGTFIYLTCS